MYFLTICRFFFFQGGWVWGVGLCVCGGGFFFSAADVKSNQAPADGYVLQPLELRRRLWLHELINGVYEITPAANTHTQTRTKEKANGNSALQVQRDVFQTHNE